MAAKRTKEKNKDRRIHIELSTGGALLWGGGLMFLLVWIFALGILVGRGSLPSDIRVAAEAPSSAPPPPLEVERPKLAFYDKLATKKDKARVREERAGRAESDGGGTRSEPAPRAREPVTEERSAGREPPLYNPPGGEAESGFTVQVAALESRGTAEEMSLELRRKGHPAYYYDVSIRGKTYFRVRCGRFVTREEAEAYVRRLRNKEGIEGFVSKLE